MCGNCKSYHPKIVNLQNLFFQLGPKAHALNTTMFKGVGREGSDGSDEPPFQRQNFLKTKNPTKSHSPGALR